MSRQLDMPQDFAKRVHQALRAWHTQQGDNELADLLLAWQIRIEQGILTPRLISNQILLNGLERLKQTDGESADLLQRRFLNRELTSEVAYRRNLSEDIIYQRQRASIDHLAAVIWAQEKVLRQQQAHQVDARLEPCTYNELFGVTEKIAEIRAGPESPSLPWIIALEGLGGIGKTALADALVREIALSGSFRDIAWVSAKQQDFLPTKGLQPINQPALDEETLVNSLLEQLTDTPSSFSFQAKQTALTKLLKGSSYLVVIDNLETVVDYQTLLPTLRKLANPSKFLLTSRHSLQTNNDVFCYSLKELSQTDTFSFLRHEAQTRGLLTLVNAVSEELDSIYQVVGGNPLALKLVVGQIAIFALPQVLNNLRQARGKKIEELYTYIYWQAWNALDEVSRQLFLAMPLAQDGDLDQLKAVTGLEVNDLNDALEQLVTLSLVEVRSNNLTERYYRIHRLTETFVLNEVTKWPRLT